MTQAQAQVIINNEALAKTLGLAVGSKVKVDTKNGIPINHEWRNRFKDASIDACITVIESSKVKKEDKK